MKTLTVNFYKSEKGKEPAREWLKSLSKEDKTIIRINLTNKEIARIFFTVSGNIMVLLHGFKKKSQQTPVNDLRIAKERRDRVFNG